MRRCWNKAADLLAHKAAAHSGSLSFVDMTWVLEPDTVLLPFSDGGYDHMAETGFSAALLRCEALL